MKIFVQTLVGLAPGLLVATVPFLLLFRSHGKRFLRSFMLCWAVFLFWIFFFSLVESVSAVSFNRDRLIAFAAFLGWLTVLVNALVKLFIARFFPKPLRHP